MLTFTSTIISEFLLVESGSHCHHITTMSECERAAAALGLPDTEATAEDDGDTVAPPWCHNDLADSDNPSLMFSAGGTNTGECVATDQCLCYGTSEPQPQPQVAIPLMGAIVLESTNATDSLGIPEGVNKIP